MKGLSYRTPPLMAVAENATTPTGVLGSTIWSTTANKLLVWDNTGKWAATATGGGGGGITGPGSSQNGGMVIYSNTAGSAVTQGPAVAENTTATLTGIYVSREANLRTFDPDRSVYPLNTSNESMLGVRAGTRYTGTPWALSNWSVRPSASENVAVMRADLIGGATAEVRDLDGSGFGYADARYTFAVSSEGLPSDVRNGSGSVGLSGYASNAAEQETSAGANLTANASITPAGVVDSTAKVSAEVDDLIAQLFTRSSAAGKEAYVEVGAVGGTVAPAAPADPGIVCVHNHIAAGRSFLSVIDSTNTNIKLQPALFGPTSFMWLPGGGTTLSIAWGIGWTARNAGTGAAQAHPTRAATNALASMTRATFSTGTTATGSSGVQSTGSVAWRGNAAGLGGFLFYARFAVETYRADLRILVGLSALNGALNVQPSTINNSCGVCKDSGDTQWQYFTRSGTNVTKVSTGVNIVAGEIFDLFMFAPPNGSDITFYMVNVMTGQVVINNAVVTTNLPVANTWMAAHAQIQSTTGTTAALLALNRMYIENPL